MIVCLAVGPYGSKHSIWQILQSSPYLGHTNSPMVSFSSTVRSFFVTLPGILDSELMFVDILNSEPSCWLPESFISDNLGVGKNGRITGVPCSIRYEKKYNSIKISCRGLFVSSKLVYR